MAASIVRLDPQGPGRSRRGLLSRSKPKRPTIRMMTASGRMLDPSNRTEAKQIKAVRQGWQQDAWSYRDSIGELRYAEKFIANSARRIRYYPAFFNDPRDTVPVPLVEASECPGDLARIAQDTWDRLGGPDATSRLSARQLANFEIAGECFLFGYEDEDAGGAERWDVKSVDEVRVTESGIYQIRELPVDIASGGDGGAMGWRDIETFSDEVFIARQWVPHPRFSILADAPLRSMLDECEELLLASRSIRASLRSRLAGAGLLYIADELDIAVANEDGEDEQQSTFFEKLINAMMAPISDEGVASAVVPILLRGPKDYADAIKHILIERPFSKETAELRVELLRRIANGLDLPAEVLLGMADLNHWTAWQVDDNTFRHHLEPIVQEGCDAWAMSLLRPGVKAVAPNVDPGLLARLCVWYDATELVTHPDRAKDAMELHTRRVLSDEALRDATGFTDQDAPSVDELLLRILGGSRSFPPNIILALFHKYAPHLEIPPDANEPGAGPGGFVPPDAAPTPATDGIEPAAGTTPPPADGPVKDATPGPPTSTTPAPASRPAVVASAARGNRRLAQQMVDIDRDVRARLQAAASVAMARALERAGAQIRSKVRGDSAVAASIRGVASDRVGGTLGQAVVAAAGLTTDELIGSPWTQLRAMWDEQTRAAAAQHLTLAAKMAHVDEYDAEPILAEFETAAARGWAGLSHALTNLAGTLLYAPHPDDTPPNLDPSTLVPTGLIRTALALAGGFGTSIDSSGLNDQGRPVDPLEPLTGMATGSIIGDFLSSNGMEERGYEWYHGPSLHPFEPHLQLDGQTFDSWVDDALLNTEGWPEVEYFAPGDHDGCICDFVPLWAGGDEEGGE